MISIKEIEANVEIAYYSMAPKNEQKILGEKIQKIEKGEEQDFY